MDGGWPATSRHHHPKRAVGFVPGCEGLRGHVCPIFLSSLGLQVAPFDGANEQLGVFDFQWCPIDHAILCMFHQKRHPLGTAGT